MIKVKDVLQHMHKVRRANVDQHKHNMLVTTEKRKLLAKMAPILNKIDFMTFGWGQFEMRNSTKDDDDFEASWKKTELVYDRLNAAGFAVETRKQFSSFQDKPRWYWTLRLPIPKVENEFITIRMGWAEPDLDCVPQQQVNVSKYWVCTK